MAFVELISLARCREEGGTFVECRGHELAVFRTGEPEEVIVLDNTCPHAGGNLSGGEITGRIVSCPWHHWEFDLRSGVCTHSPLARVRRYPAHVREGIVWVDLQNAEESNVETSKRRNVETKPQGTERRQV